MDILNIYHHRSRKRIKDLGEVFTPERYVYQMLDMLEKSVWADEDTVFFEPTCGHGNFVVAIVERRLKAFLKKAKRKNIRGAPFYAIANAINNLWAIDIDKKNIDLCRNRVWEILNNFAQGYDKGALRRENSKKVDIFWAHILCCIKWQICENEMFSALEEDPEMAKVKAEQTVISKKWFRKNGHNPIDFELPWTEYFRALEENGTTPIEFSRSLKFVSALKVGLRRGSFQDFVFAHPQQEHRFEEVA